MTGVSPDPTLEPEQRPSSVVAGLDLGGTKILGVTLDAETGQVVAERKIPNPRAGTGAVIDAFAELTSWLVADDQRLLGIGVGMAGLVDRAGVLRYGPNVPGIFDFSVREQLEARLEVPVAVENDVAMAARAELDRGAAQGFRNVVMVTQGTGIGCALVVDGVLMSGANGFAGEPGHIIIRRGGHLCACGQRGCWEAYASGSGLVNLWNDLRDEGRGLRILERAGGERSAVRGEHISAAAADGDPDATEIFERFAGWVAQGLGALVTLLDPDLIVLGGGLVVVSDHFIDDVRTRMHEFVLGDQHRPPVPVVGAALGERAGAVGAALRMMPATSD